MLPDNTYVVAHAFMVNELGLKGKELWVYATIYGFSQDGDSWFSGAQAFIAEWADCSPRWVRKILANLEARGLIEKRVQRVQGKTFNEYRISPAELSSAGRNSVPRVGTQFQNQRNSVPKPAELSSANNNKYIYRDNNNPPIVPPAGIAKEVVDYLNLKAHTAFKASSKQTRSHISARVAEGYGIDDFKAVIDCKCGEWLGDSKMQQYLRPSTLFGTKFEAYREQARAQQSEETAYDDRFKPKRTTVVNNLTGEVRDA